MNNYDFKKLTKEDKWKESQKNWVKENPEEYVRLLIINDEVDLLKKFEKEPVSFDFSYQLKDQILLTLAMEKQAYKMIDYFLNKNLIIKHRDIEGLVKNFREEKEVNQFTDVLEKIDFSKVDVNKILKNLEDYYYEETIVTFLDYILEKNIELDNETYEKLKEEDNLSFIMDKHKKRKHFEALNNQFSSKEKGKSHKI